MKKQYALLLLSVVSVGLSAKDGVPLLKVAALGNDSNVVFEDSFDYALFEGPTLYDDGIWVNEANKARPINENGVLKASAGYSARFNYQNIEGFVFDTSKTYTFKFDVKITDFGTDHNNVTSRELYVAPDGYYNQVELRSNANANAAIRAGGTYAGTTGNEYTLNTTYSIKIEWQPSANKITSTVSNGDTVIATGSRTNSVYGTNTEANRMHNWVFRCEDGAYEMDNFSFTDGTINYTQDFESKIPENAMVYQGYWRTGVMERVCSAPTVADGKVKFKDGEAIEFCWTKLSTYDQSKRFTYEFDVKITDLGDGSQIDPNVDTQTRALYVAPGGYYNQLQIYTKDGTIVAGDTGVVPFDAAKHLNKDLHVKLVYEGDTITTTLYDENGNVIVTGARSNSAYTNTDARMSNWAIRCEDGACEIDNFKFSEQSIVVTDLDSVEVPSGKALNYSFDLKYNSGDETSVTLNGSSIISLSNEGMKVGTGYVNGTYESGTYKVNVYINPTQKMVNVEVTLPNGGVIRRGAYSYISGSTTSYKLSVKGLSENIVSNANSKLEDITVNSYELTRTLPTYEGVNQYIYNIITSFEDAATSRSFAWTATQNHFSTSDMSLKYKVQGADAWTTVDALMENETVNLSENYYKADIYNLTPNTTYEYKIGVKGSQDEVNEWTKAYTFTTASGDESEFSFIAVGDTQGITWDGTSASNKGFMYAKAAYEQALKEVPNPAFMMHAGDVVENGDNVNQWNYFFKSVGDSVASIPHFATIGNHDAIATGSDPRFYFNLHFNHPNNGGVSAMDPEYVDDLTHYHLKLLAQQANETVYSYNYGDAHFVVLNTGAYAAQDQYIIEAQRKWLELDLESNSCSKWTVVLFHEPVYHRLGGNESRPWLYDVIEKYNVDLVIQGHSHLVTRTYPMKDGKIVSKENIDSITQGTGTVYTTIGSTALNHDSMGTRNVEECAVIKTPESEQPTYTVVNVKDDKLVMTVKQVNGLVVDSFEILANEALHVHHGEELLQNAKEATCLENGYTGDKVCSYCEKIIEQGTVIEAAGKHSFGDWEVSKNPTTEEQGEKKRTCGECGEIEVEVIDKLPSVDTSDDPSDEPSVEPSTPDSGNTEQPNKGCRGASATGIVGVTLLSLIAVKSKKKSKK